MNLTEPHCGTDLGLLRTKAVPQADGSYRITGTKIFISAGEHDLADNIVHLVLARIEGAPAGTQGISLFIVPKFMPTRTARSASATRVSCGSIEEKMGIHGNATCVMNYDGATGWLVGEENSGLDAMFVMMNEARLGVGMQGLAHVRGRLPERRRLRAGPPAGPRARRAEVSRQAGRPDHRPPGRAPHADDDPRLQRGGARRWCCGPRCKGDVAHRSPDEKERQAADDHVALMTPVIKGVLTDMGFANAVAGAAGVRRPRLHRRDTGMEQFVRDARIAMIYEGANGIQALDLVGRKLPRDGGRAVHGVLQRARRLPEGERRGRGAGAASRSR